MLNLLTANLVLSTLIFWVIARIYVFPNLGRVSARDILIPILLLHTARHLGLMFLSSGATLPGLPATFALPAALGDLGAAVLAALALSLLLAHSKYAKASIWIFNTWGVIDLALAICVATIYRAEPFMGAAYWIPAFWVPALLVTHYLTFFILTRRELASSV